MWFSTDSPDTQLRAFSGIIVLQPNSTEIRKISSPNALNEISLSTDNLLRGVTLGFSSGWAVLPGFLFQTSALSDNVTAQN
jgi:hypothetical protein